MGNGVHESVSTRVRVIGESHRGLNCDRLVVTMKNYEKRLFVLNVHL